MRKKQQQKQGFTLVEIVVAIAIIALACVPLLALLPAGIHTIQRGKQEIIDQTILRDIHNELSSAEWEKTKNLKDFHQKLRYFDNEAIPIEEEKAAYTIQILIDEENYDLQNHKNPFLRKIEVRITNAPPSVIQRFNNSFYYRTYSILTAKINSITE